MERKRRNSPESDIQKAFFKWLHLWNKAIAFLTFHIPNGGSRHILEARNLKSLGVTPGVPDVFCAVPSYKYHGLFIEFKSKKGVISKNQEDMMDALSSQGYKVSICRDWIEAKEIMEWYQQGMLDVQYKAI